MFSFIRQTFCQWARTGTRRSAQPPAVRQPQFEALEDRILLSLTGAQLFANSLPSSAQAVLASAPDGRAVVAWTVENTPIDHDIHAQLFDAAGHKTGSETVVAGGREDQYHPAVAMNANGDFVVAWVMTFFGNDTDIHASVFRSDGSRVANDVPVVFTFKPEFDASVGMDARGDFVVSYTLQFGPGDTDVLAKQFDAHANLLRSIDVAVGAQDSEDHSHVLMNSGGSFAVSYLDNGASVVKHFSADGQFLGGGEGSGQGEGGSGSHRPPPHRPPPPHHKPPHVTPTLHGTLAGGYAIRSVGDTGTRYDLVAIGDLAGLGETLLTGDLRSTRFLSLRHAFGTLTLTGHHGTVTLDLEGPRQKGFVHLPQQFHFTVEASTGAYRHLHENGLAILHLSPVSHTFTLDLMPRVR
jgi:hypothetical protein